MSSMWVPASSAYFVGNRYGGTRYPQPAVWQPTQSPEIWVALQLLQGLRNLPQDEAYLQGLGVNIVFKNGAQALEAMARRQACIEFGDFGDSNAHAAWSARDNKMLINPKYRGDMTLPVLYAIAASIYHEAGHAVGVGDNQSSLQEEIDCLALNVLAYRAQLAADARYAYTVTQGPAKALLEDGVALYANLFFDPDPTKQALVNRIIKIYGQLPAQTPDHAIPVLPYGTPLVYRVLTELQQRRAMAGLA